MSSRQPPGMSFLSCCPVYISAVLRGVKQAATREVFFFHALLSISLQHSSLVLYCIILVHFPTVGTFITFTTCQFLDVFIQRRVSTVNFLPIHLTFCLIFLKHYSTFYNNVNIKYFLFIYKSPSLRDRIVKKMFYIF